MILAAILLILVILILVNMKPSGKKEKHRVQFDTSDKWVVYGSLDCPWTVKQLDHFNKEGFKHGFVNCDNGKCPSEVDGYPTLISSSGTVVNGYTTIDKLVKNSKKKSGTWKVYGSRSCGWTNKQIAYMRKNGKQFKFVDCDTEECEGIDSYPTLITPEGKMILGYTEV